MTHTLKSWPGEFEAQASGDKKHEIRDCTDRKFAKGDDVILQEWVPAVSESGPTGGGHYTKRALLRKITYVNVAGSWGLPPNLCVFSTESVK